MIKCVHGVIIKQYCGMGLSLKQLLKDVFRKTITSINLGFIVYICDAHKMLYFCNQNGIVTFCQSCLLVRFLVNTATFVEKLWVFEFLCDSNIGR